MIRFRFFTSGSANAFRADNADRRFFSLDQNSPKVSIRVSSPDPFNGLRGHAYIEARGLAPKIGPMRTADNADTCQCQPCAQVRLLPAVQAICAAQYKRSRAEFMRANIEALRKFSALHLVERGR